MVLALLMNFRDRGSASRFQFGGVYRTPRPHPMASTTEAIGDAEELILVERLSVAVCDFVHCKDHSGIKARLLMLTLATMSYGTT